MGITRYNLFLCVNWFGCREGFHNKNEGIPLLYSLFLFPPPLIPSNGQTPHHWTYLVFDRQTSPPLPPFISGTDYVLVGEKNGVQ